MATIAQLQQEQTWLLCALDHGRFEDSPDRAEEALRRIEEIDLAIAAIPASSLEDLWLKMSRLRASLGLDAAAGNQATLFNALIEDCVRLIRAERRAKSRAAQSEPFSGERR